MKNDFTELVFILDRSGSMGGLEGDTIGGFNSMLKKQRAETGECRVTTVLFDDKYEILHDRIDINAVRPITGKDYFVRGSTALLDAVGRAIDKVKAVQKNTAEDFRAGKVLFIITTDGMENASVEFGYKKIKSMVERQKEKYGWEFIFFGANIDAVEIAGRVGIDKSRAVNYHADAVGVRASYDSMNLAVSEMRAARGRAELSENWGSAAAGDFRSRQKK